MAKKANGRRISACRSSRAPRNITLVFDDKVLPSIAFDAKTGQSGKKAHSKLKKILDTVEAKGEVKTATKTAAKAVTAAVKTVSKEAVKAVSDRKPDGNGS